MPWKLKMHRTTTDQCCKLRKWSGTKCSQHKDATYTCILFQMYTSYIKVQIKASHTTAPNIDINTVYTGSLKYKRTNVNVFCASVYPCDCIQYMLALHVLCARVSVCIYMCVCGPLQYSCAFSQCISCHRSMKYYILYMYSNIYTHMADTLIALQQNRGIFCT